MMLRLHNYQKIGVKRLVQGNCLLADSMGLGKSVMTAVALRCLKPDRVLIVCPKSMIPTWLTELEKWWPESRFERWNCGSFSATGVVRLVTNYERLSGLPSLKWDVLIADEIHKCKNPQAQRSQCVRKLARRSKLVWGLSGTLILNRADEIWLPLNLVCLKQFRSRWNFAIKWCKTKPSTWSQSGIEILPGIKDGEEENFAKMLEPYVLRRTKAMVKLELPNVTRVDRWLDMTEYQAALHKDILKNLKVEIEAGNVLTIRNVLARTLYARRCAVSPLLVGGSDAGAKFEALDDLLEEIEGRVVVFSQWTDPLFKFAELYRKCKGPESGYKNDTYFLTGNMSGPARDREIKAWKTSKRPGALLSTYEAGGVGLTLVESSVAITLDDPYVPAIVEQAIARLDRIGQTEPVTVYHLRCRKSLEEWVHKLVGRKSDMIANINRELEKL